MRRPVVAILAAAGLGVALALVALLPHWATQTYGSDHSGRLSLSGPGAVPAVLPLVLVAAAGVVAAWSVGGTGSRIIAAATALSGLGIGGATIAFLAHPPAQAAAAGTVPPAPADLLDPVVVHPAGPALALAGALALALAGVAIMLRPPRRRLRGRFERRPSPTGGPTSGSAGPEGWWAALDGGTDPTAPPPSDPPPARPPAAAGFEDRSTRQDGAATMSRAGQVEETNR